MASLGDLMVRIGVDADQVGRDLERTQGFFERHGQKLAVAGAAIGAGAAAAIGVGVTAALEKERLGDKLAAQLGGSEAEAQRLGKAAGDLYAQGLGSGLEEVNNAIRGVVTNIDGMAAASEADLKAVTGSVVNLGTAFGEDVGEVSRAVGKMIKTGLAKDATEALDILTVGFQSGANEAADLLDTFTEYSTQFRNMGLDGQTAMGLLSQGLKAGARDADVVADAIKEFSIEAVAGSDKIRDAYDELGLNADKMFAALGKGGPEAAQALDLTLDKLRAIQDPVKRNAMAVELFGTKAEDLGDSLYALDPSSAVSALGDVEGAAQRMGDTLNDNAATGIESWKRKTESAMASLVGAPGVLGDTAQAATGMAQALAPAASGLGGLAMAAIAGAQLLPAMARGAAMAATAVASGTASMVASMARTSAAMTVTSARYVAGWVVMGTQSTLAAGRVALAWLIAMGPAALVIAAVLALVALVALNWDKVKTYTGATWNWVTNKTAAAWEAIRAVFVRVLRFLANLFLNFTGPGLIIKHWTTVRNATSSTWAWVVARVQTAVRGTLAAVGWIAALPGRVAGWFGRVRDAAVSRAQNLVAWLRGLPGRILAALGRLNMLLYNAGRNVITGLINGITSMIGRVGSAMSGIASRIRNFLPFSPAKEGPLSGKGSPDLAGAKIGGMLADGITSSATLVRGASMQLAAAAAPPNMFTRGVSPAKPKLAGATAPASPNTSVGSAWAYSPAPAAREKTVIEIRGDGSRYGDLLVEELRHRIAVKGGDVQLVLGSRLARGSAR
ncbi:phage tail tape measure protein [Actinocorallia sp. API 0066]|uniref:phage tail tape measure protein n=1 Tax=Actinocorallia sp. API 0066 TaxID=2896846 RepID=UPI001E45FC58|nr:phage tail tape measure protein [Actinocorallia sp. API 0066]MCD0450762.1 phage tail tape measure protein [Actinocorallia sp. API 0066]